MLLAVVLLLGDTYSLSYGDLRQGRLKYFGHSFYGDIYGAHAKDGRDKAEHISTINHKKASV